MLAPPTGCGGIPNHLIMNLFVEFLYHTFHFLQLKCITQGVILGLCAAPRHVLAF